MRGLVISSIILGVICTIMAAVLVLSGGKLIAVSEGWARAASLAFLCAIACSRIPAEESISAASAEAESKEEE